MWNETPENFQQNDAGGLVFTVKSKHLDAPLVVDGIHRISVIPDGPKVSKSRVAGGMITFNKLRNTGGKAEVEISDSSTSMGPLSVLANLEDAVSISSSDPVTPDLNVSCGYAFLEKHPDIVRSEETNTTVWVFECAVLKAKTGGFTIIVEQ